MILFTCLFLSFIKIASLECVLDSSSRHISWEENLHNDLKCNYHNMDVPEPGKETKNTTVAIRFVLRTFNFYNHEEEFSMYSWMFLSWYDPSLKWNPADYDDIDATLFKPRLIWTPDIRVDNQLDAEINLLYAYASKCQVFHDGHVLCVPRISHTIICQSKLSNWPYDIQTCHFNYTAKENVKLTHNGTRGISAMGAEYGTGWTIIAYEFADPDELRDNITITFVVERTALGLSTINVVPLIVIVVLNIAAMVMDVKNNTRVYILCFCLVSNFMFLQTVNENIPKKGFDIPTVLIFLRTSIFLSALSITITFVLKNLRRKTNPTPSYIVNFNELFLKDSRKNFIWPKWEADDIEDEALKKATEEWTAFTHVLNSLIVIIYSILYPVLFIIYMPRPLPSIE